MSDGGTPIWHKGTAAEDWVTRFTVGDDAEWDTLLLPYDCAASEAHAWGLAQIGVLTAEEHASVAEALERLAKQHAEGTIRVHVEDEDMHTVIERFLVEELGETGRKIHTGRSRNDQVLAALRLFIRDRLAAIGLDAARLVERLCELGASSDGIVIPGYTHMQRAMPSTVALWALGYGELLVEDLALVGFAGDRINVSPLGSAAGYGVPYLELPREAVARRLGFRGIQTHVTAVQLSRGKFEAQVVHALTQLAATINRMASDLVLFATSEFGFVTLPEAYTTGSSIMPQKRNPDVLELARAAFHRMTAELQVLLSTPANLPGGYHRDLQPTKASVMRAVLLCGDLVQAMAAVLPGVRFDAARAAGAMSPDLYATAAAMRRVKDGEAFRDAYREVAGKKDEWKAEAGRSVEDIYRMDGGPGRTDPGVVIAGLREATRWIPKPADPGQTRNR